jgi:hypothetical protein
MNMPSSDFWLIQINFRDKVRLMKNHPTIRPDEVAVKMHLEVPDAFFKRPMISGKIVIDPKAVPPSDISSEVLINTAALIEQSLGFKVELTVQQRRRSRIVLQIVIQDVIQDKAQQPAAKPEEVKQNVRS